MSSQGKHAYCPGAYRAGASEADHKSASSEQQKEARHRKDDAAGRSPKDDAHQSKHEHGKAEGCEEADKPRGNPAQRLAGIWKELNEESNDGESDPDRDKQHEQVGLTALEPCAHFCMSHQSSW